MKLASVAAVSLAWTLIVLSADGGIRAADVSPTWSKDAAAKYLDERAGEWYAFARANRGEDETKTTCVSCHSLVSYAFGRPALRKLTGAEPTEYEQKLLAQVKLRVAHWDELDSLKFHLAYDFDEQKQKESRGTEAVLNALVLALDDRSQGRSSPADATRQAFSNLWRTQIAEGDQQGSWDWLDFKYEPWESARARYFGAALAAVAVGTSPGYYTPGADPEINAGVRRLKNYLSGRRGEQTAFNRTWLLWASRAVGGLLTPEQQQAEIAGLFALQRVDGGWRLASLLGDVARSDGTPQDEGSDGYATGLVLHVLQIAGISKDDARIARGLAWLRANQAPSGQWQTSSLNKQRDPATHIGRFMSDAATAFAVLALSD